MRLPIIIKNFFSDDAMRELYERRRALNPAEENRTGISMTITGLIFTALLVFIIGLAWQRQDLGAFVKGHPSIVNLEANNTTWLATPVTRKGCESGRSCFDAESLRADRSLERPLSRPGIPFPAELATTDRGVFSTTLSLDPMDWQRLHLFKTLVLTLPKVIFERADVYISGEHYGSFFDSQPLSIAFESNQFSTNRFNLTVVYELAYSGEYDAHEGNFASLPPLSKGVNILPQPDYNDYLEVLALEQAGRGDYVGMIARIVMAIFVLALFLIIDGSPESLGLALFLGFEAFAISNRFDWLPLANVEFLTHFSYQMGDIFRLYFFLQLARLIPKQVGPWLVIGTLISIPYGVLRHYGAEWDLNWLYHIPRMRDIFVGTIGTLVCVRGAYFLRSHKVPWRVVALCVAAMGSFEQVFAPLGAYVSFIGDSSFYNLVSDVLQPIAVWLLAFSAFINISTLENRVKELSQVKAQAEKIKQEMELGRTVQKSFLSIPKTPESLILACHHEAMTYVSGDTYFVNWNEEDGVLAMLINDVTGHGIQAGLKASGANVIANTVWKKDVDHAAGQSFEDSPSKLLIYENLVTDFYARLSSSPDIISLTGMEVITKRRSIRFYRANFPFPVSIKWQQDRWEASIIALPNQTMLTRMISDLEMVLIASDGFMDGSREVSHFVEFLNHELMHFGPDLDPEAIKQLIIDCDILQGDRTLDDRTFIVFQWCPPGARVRLQNAS